MSTLTRTSDTRPGVGATDSQIAKILPTAWQTTQHIDPAEIRPMAGRVLIRDEHNDSQIGSIVIPQTIERKDRERIGRIVAVGLGDRWIELEKRGPYGVLRLKGIKCRCCKGTGTLYINTDQDNEPHWAAGDVVTAVCPYCKNGLLRLPMQTKPGDRVLYKQRREAEIEVGGEVLTLAYEEQAVLAVLEDQEDEAERKRKHDEKQRDFETYGWHD